MVWDVLEYVDIAVLRIAFWKTEAGSKIRLGYLVKKDREHAWLIRYPLRSRPHSVPCISALLCKGKGT
jgi:hypothetical protein